MKFCEIFGSRAGQVARLGHLTLLKNRNHAMGTVRMGSAWNVQDCLVSSVPTKRMSQNFHPGDLRSGQFRDLPIISLWGNMKMLPVSLKSTEATQFFQDDGHSPHLWWSRRNWWLGEMRSPEIKWGQNPVFANNSRQDGDRDAKLAPNDLAREDASEDMHIELTYFGHDLTLAWPGLAWPWPDLGLAWLISNFEIDLSR